MKNTLLLAVCILGITGCGQFGKLYLPDTDPQTERLTQDDQQ